MTTKSDISISDANPAAEAAPPPSYGDALQTPWQGTSTATPSHGISPRPPLDPEQYPLYSTSIPANAEDPTSAERLVVGIATSVKARGEVVTHDPRLHDPVTMEAFLKQQAAIPPILKICCYGYHNHQSHIMDSNHNYNDPVNRNRSQNDIVVDFNFEIDLTSILEATVDSRTLLTVRPDRAVPRGTFSSTFHPEFRPYGPHYRETSWLDWLRGRSTNVSDTFDSESRATKPGVRPIKREKQVWKRLSAARYAKGLPSWTPLPQDVGQEIQAVRDHVVSQSQASYQQSSHGRSTNTDGAYARLETVEDGYSASNGAELENATLLDWCREFCQSPLPLKEFRFHKIVYGWEPSALLAAVRAAIASTDYQGTVNVQFIQQRSVVTVLPDNHLTKWLSKTSVLLLLWVTLLYPFVWLYKRLVAGGKWAVANAWYPLKCYVPYGEAKSLEGSTAVAGNQEVRLGPSSADDADPEDAAQLFQLHGYKEGRFMKRWESRIKDAVVRRAGANGFVESLGDALLVERQDAEGRETIRALDGYESA